MKKLRNLFILLILCLITAGCSENSGLSAQEADASALDPVSDGGIKWQIWPEPGRRDVSVYPQLTVTGEQGIDQVSGHLEGGGYIIGGDWEVEDGLARFSPYQILTRGTTYEFIGEINGEPLKTDFTVTKAPMPDQWIEVALGTEQRVYIWEDEEVKKVFPCSGGLPESPSLTGIYQLKDKGLSFYSQRFCEGARYWFRIQDQYLFHSVPRDENQQIIQSELEKIGTAASHGCIRLYDEDAQWIYENIPKGTTVILHPAVPDLFTKNLLESGQG